MGQDIPSGIATSIDNRFDGYVEPRAERRPAKGCGERPGNPSEDAYTGLVEKIDDHIRITSVLAL